VKEERLLKYHFLALPGTKAPTMEEDNTMMIKSRFYLHNAIKQIIKTNVIIPSLYHYLRPAGNRGIPPFLAVACLCISDKLGDIQFIVRKTRDRISIYYLSLEW
jgi:hypothetical protein